MSKSPTSTPISPAPVSLPESGITSYRHAFSPPLRVPFHNTEPSMTVQSFKDECDVNTIMARYRQTGMLPPPRSQPQYTDLTGYDFQTAQNLIAEGKSMFNQLPASIRSQFDNDPAAFLDFASNPENRVAMAEMGLLTPEAASAALSSPTPTNPVPGAPPSPLPANPSGISNPASPSSTPPAA